MTAIAVMVSHKPIIVYTISMLLWAWITLASLAPSDGHGDIGVVFLASATPGIVPLASVTWAALLIVPNLLHSILATLGEGHQIVTGGNYHYWQVYELLFPIGSRTH